MRSSSSMNLPMAEEMNFARKIRQTSAQIVFTRFEILNSENFEKYDESSHVFSKAFTNKMVRKSRPIEVY